MSPVFHALLGGVLIGVAATVLLAGDGRIAGNSGMLHGLLPARPKDTAWRLLYLLGLALGAWAYGRLRPEAISTAALSSSFADPLALLIGGVLVGVGTRLGGGCTSGHGICGLARLSKRSLAAVLTFMAVGMLTVAVIRLVLP